MRNSLDGRTPPSILLSGAPAERHRQIDFFRQLRMPNGTYKTTAQGRMPEFDEAIAASAPTDAETLLDIGISAGVATDDLMLALKTSGHNIKSVTATDLFLHARLWSAFSMLEMLTYRDGILAIRIGPRTLFASSGATNLRTRWARTVFRAGASFCRFLETMHLGSSQQLDLLIPDLRREKSLVLLEDDIGSRRVEWEGKFDIVRAANLINLAYFSRRICLEMLHNAASYVRVGGILCVGRTDDAGLTHATIWTRTATSGCWAISRVLGEGSDVSLEVR